MPIVSRWVAGYGDDDLAVRLGRAAQAAHGRIAGLLWARARFPASKG
jgi:hypothetical protein